MFVLMSVCLLFTMGGLRPDSTRHAKNAPMPVGWHDEFNDLGGWKPIGLENAADVYAARPGAMTLRLPHVPEGFPWSFQWSGVTATASVDLGRYPIVVARISRVQKGSYAHLDLEERDYSGHPVRTLRSSTVVEPGLSVLDLGKEWGSYTRRIVLRLIVGGALTGAQCEYAWVRFVRREDLPILMAHPDWQNVVLRP